jgi:hypothetical protein
MYDYLYEKKISEIPLRRKTREQQDSLKDAWIKLFQITN